MFASKFGEYTEISCMPSHPPHVFSTSPTKAIHLLQLKKSTLIHNTHPNPTAQHYGSLCCTVNGLGQMHKYGTHYYGITQNIFIALRIFCAPPLLSLSSPTSGSPWSSYSCLFQNVMYLEQCSTVAFSDWLLSSSSKYVFKFGLCKILPNFLESCLADKLS